jgi:hypothetical protein
MSAKLRGQGRRKAKRLAPSYVGHKSVAGEAYQFLSHSSASFSAVDGATKRVIVQRLASGDFGARFRRFPVTPSAFDMVQIPGRRASEGGLTAREARDMPRERFQRIRLIEVKAARGPLDKSLRGLFFSFQYPEQLAAQTLGDRYRIIFVVINQRAADSFYREMSWSKMWSMARYIHLQFSVQF